MSQVERRDLVAAEIRTESSSDGGTKISGYAALFGTPSYQMRTAKGSTFKEVVMPGAFGDAGTADVMARYNHQLILGRTSAGTLKLTVDERGLKYEITPSNSALTGHVLEAVKRGDVKGSSFAFHPIAEKWRSINGENVREIHAVGLVDVGPVDSPAYGSTADGDNAVSVRSLGTDEAAIDAAVAKLGPIKCGPGSVTENRYYYNDSASNLTRTLRAGIESARQMFDNATAIADALAAQRLQLTEAEQSAASDLADEMTRCLTRLGECAEALKASGAAAVEPAVEDPAAERSNLAACEARIRLTPLV